MPVNRALEWLSRVQNADGSWGYQPAQTGRGEPTAFAVATGLEAPVAWLSAQDADWTSLLALSVLVDRPEAHAVVAGSVAWALEARGEVTESGGTYDTTIPAWPWFLGTAPWVEPTAYAAIGLKRAGHATHSRVIDAERFLRDRQCRDGGWNYGNPDVLGSELESFLPATAWGAMALPTGPDTARALARLQLALQWRSTLNLGSAILAHIAHDADATPFVDPLLARQALDGSWGGRVDLTGLAVTALQSTSTGTHPWRVA